MRGCATLRTPLATIVLSVAIRLGLPFCKHVCRLLKLAPDIWFGMQILEFGLYEFIPTEDNPGGVRKMKAGTEVRNFLGTFALIN